MWCWGAQIEDLFSDESTQNKFVRRGKPFNFMAMYDAVSKELRSRAESVQALLKEEFEEMHEKAQSEFNAHCSTMERIRAENEKIVQEMKREFEYHRTQLEEHRKLEEKTMRDIRELMHEICATKPSSAPESTAPAAAGSEPGEGTAAADQNAYAEFLGQDAEVCVEIPSRPKRVRGRPRKYV